jgi:hypothetical protein
VKTQTRVAACTARALSLQRSPFDPVDSVGYWWIHICFPIFNPVIARMIFASVAGIEINRSGSIILRA